MTRHVFDDETKDRDYLLIASVHTSGDLDELRKLIRRVVVPGQYRVHMKKESDSRKRLIASTIVDAGVTATVYDAGRGYRPAEAQPPTPDASEINDHQRFTRDTTQIEQLFLGTVVRRI